MSDTNGNGRPTTHALLAEYARLLNKHGPDAPEPEHFLKAYQEDDELLDLAETARWLKKSLTEFDGPASTSADNNPHIIESE